MRRRFAERQPVHLDRAVRSVLCDPGQRSVRAALAEAFGEGQRGDQLRGGDLLAGAFDCVEGLVEIARLDRDLADGTGAEYLERAFHRQIELWRDDMGRQ